MVTQALAIDKIPALLWGEPADRLLVAVHGDQSHKGDEVICVIAEAAAEAGYQTLSFDLPEHGDRKGTAPLCEPQACVPELRAVLQYARPRWRDISLFACSIGAYFSLLAFREEPLNQCLFLSPVVDMERLIANMMQWFSVDENRLRAEKEIPTPMGKTLYWDYYSYVKDHPIERWDHPTSILRGERDDLSEAAVVTGFAERFGCGLTVLDGAEHFFHTQEELADLKQWVAQRL